MIRVVEGAGRLFADTVWRWTGVGLSENTARIFALVFSVLLLRVIHKCVLAAVTAGLRHRRGEERGKAVVILGQCGSGKTSLFFLLRSWRFPETVSSLKPNKDSFVYKTSEADVDVSNSADDLGKASRRMIEAIDFPGHQKLQSAANAIVPKARCVIYAIDSADKANIKAAAEHLFELFTSDSINALKPPFLIACNKSDLLEARRPQEIKTSLEREIERLRTSRGATLEGQDEAEGFLGVENEAFDFSAAPCPVTFCRCSVKNREVSEVFDFLAAHHQ